jgi:cytidylate kinase
MSSTDALLDRQLRRWELERQSARAGRAPAAAFVPQQPIVTVSRQHGSAGARLAARLAERFDYTLLHRGLIDTICATTGHQHRLLASLDEHTRSELTAWVTSLIAGQAVDASDYVRALLETVRAVARLGGVVVVGRGANFIVGPDEGFHLRVVAPREQRVRTVAARRGVSPHEAEREVDASDRERAAFIRKVYHRGIDDPLGYDLIVDLGALDEDTAFETVVTAAHGKFRALRAAAQKAHV